MKTLYAVFVTRDYLPRTCRTSRRSSASTNDTGTTSGNTGMGNHAIASCNGTNYQTERRFFSRSCKMIGVRISCMAMSCLPPGMTMEFARDMKLDRR